MVRIGLVGIGFMGYIHYLAAQKVSGGSVAAVCSRDPVKLSGDWRAIRGNFGPPGAQMDLSGVKKYTRFDDLLTDPDIDLIDICTVTDQHAPMAIAALKAGKHVLVEKAIALTTADADAMVAAAKAAGKLLMVAHVLPFFPEFAFAYDAVRTSKYGKLLGGHLTRVIAKPDWSAAIGDADATGGPAVDLHIHDTHFVGLIAGVPKAVSSTGIVNGGSVDYLTTNYLYGSGGPALSCSSGAVATKGRQFVHGFELYFERATLAYSSGGPALTVFNSDGTSEQPKLGDGDPIAAFTTEIQTAVEAVKSGEMPALLSGQLARDALVLCHRECESVKTGAVVPIS